MIFLLLVGFICVAADESIEEAKQNCNCTRLLHDDLTNTDPPPTFPTTSFTCWGRYDGYYADTEVDCTIFHYCQTWYFPTGLNETVKWDFACPQSTIFNQKILSCTPPNISFDCQESPNYYWVNWINSTESPTFAPTPAPGYSTPGSNVGQQLIVGGLQPQETPVSDSLVQENSEVLDDNPQEVSPEPSLSETSQPQEVPIPEHEGSSNVANSDPEQFSETIRPQDPIPDSVPQESSNINNDNPEFASGQPSL